MRFSTPEASRGQVSDLSGELTIVIGRRLGLACIALDMVHGLNIEAISSREQTETSVEQ